MNTVAFFLPVRAGSQRVKNKNTKPFAGRFRLVVKKEFETGLMQNY